MTKDEAKEQIIEEFNFICNSIRGVLVGIQKRHEQEVEKLREDKLCLDGEIQDMKWDFEDTKKQNAELKNKITEFAEWAEDMINSDVGPSFSIKEKYKELFGYKLERLRK